MKGTKELFTGGCCRWWCCFCRTYNFIKKEINNVSKFLKLMVTHNCIKTPSDFWIIIILMQRQVFTLLWNKGVERSQGLVWNVFIVTFRPDDLFLFWIIINLFNIGFVQMNIFQRLQTRCTRFNCRRVKKH